MTSYERLVSFFGGQVKTAECLGVKQGTVSGWVSGRHGMSAEVALRAELLTEGAIKARELRPSLP